MRLFTPDEWAAMSPAQRVIIGIRRRQQVARLQARHRATYDVTPAQRLAQLGIAIERHRNRRRGHG